MQKLTDCIFYNVSYNRLYYENISRHSENKSYSKTHAALLIFHNLLFIHYSNSPFLISHFILLLNQNCFIFTKMYPFIRFKYKKKENLNIHQSENNAFSVNAMWCVGINLRIFPTYTLHTLQSYVI